MSATDSLQYMDGQDWNRTPDSCWMMPLQPWEEPCCSSGVASPSIEADSRRVGRKGQRMRLSIGRYGEGRRVRAPRFWRHVNGVGAAIDHVHTHDSPSSTAHRSRGVRVERPGWVGLSPVGQPDEAHEKEYRRPRFHCRTPWSMDSDWHHRVTGEPRGGDDWLRNSFSP